MRNHIHVTTKMSGKMLNMTSINTSPINNPYCQAMAKVENSVCGKCYSTTMMKRYKTADLCFQRNGELMNERLIPMAELPIVNAHTVRFSAHGELLGAMHLANLFGICNRNPRTNFTLWTKRKDLVNKVIRDFGKPKNLILIFSSDILNKQEKLPRHFDKVFTVYEIDKVEKVNINCGAKKCYECMTCYDPENKEVYINELKH